MSTFNLPDLGEGLPEAEIHEWFVKEGDEIVIDQPLVSMETAKAVVDVPSPETGIIGKLFGKPGDVIKTGDPLVSFVSNHTVDKGTVVGNLEESLEAGEDNFTYHPASDSSRIKATSVVKMLAKKLKVDLTAIKGSGINGTITREDVQAFANNSSVIPTGFEPLKGVRKTMLNNMVKSHMEVVPVSIFDEADISKWQPNTDITVRLIKAIIYGVSKEPSLNAWFSTQHSARQCFEQVHLGLAMDNKEGLFVPVIHNAAKYSDLDLRQIINEFKASVEHRTITADKLTGATLILSNFGKFAGRYASPIIVPPMVSILAVGKLYQAAIPENNIIEIHNMLPLSLSFDHRAITGGEATRFLGAVIESLTQA